jgi:hypothetical protein
MDVNMFSFIRFSGITAITEEDMPRNKRPELDPNKKIELYVYEILKLTFGLALLLVLGVYGLKHFNDMVPQPRWVWASLPVIALILRVCVSIYQKQSEEEL